MGVALGTAELWVSQTHWKCGSEQAVHRGHLGTSVETQLQCPLKSHPNTSTCVLRHLMEQPKVRESWEGTSCHKKTLQHCRSPQCFLGSLLVPSLCRDIHHPEDRPVTPHLLSLPNTLQMANDGAARQKLVLPTSKASTTALWKPCLPSAGDVFCQCTDTKQRGESFFPLFHGIRSCPKEEQKGKMNAKTQQYRSEETTRTHSSQRDYAQTAAKILVCPLLTHCPLLPLAFLALAASVRCLGPGHAFPSS